MDCLAVVLGAVGVDTGCQALTQLGVHASAAATAQVAPAFAQREYPVDDTQGFAHCLSRGERTEIDAAVIARFAHDAQPGECCRHVEHQIGILLIVAEDHIVAWPVAFDQVVFQDQRVFFRGGHDGFKGNQGAHHQA